MVFKHQYIPATEEDKKAMLEELGIKSVEELYKDIPRKIRLNEKLRLPEPQTEIDLSRSIEKLMSRNITHKDIPVFLGSGIWLHYVPAIVKALVSLPEFQTSYTPYQPEISQGILQALFEYQSMICEITGMDIANASMYDWASALGEAALMTARVTKKEEFLIPKIIHPERRATLETYTHNIMRIRDVPYVKETGVIDTNALESMVSKKTAGIYVENPNYLGVIEFEAAEIGKIAHENDALFVVGVDPTSLGVLESPGQYGADIVIGEGQPLGIDPYFGGPLLGLFACREDKNLVRNMPGRLIGITEDVRGNRCYTITLQTREQHIRREKATSNICSNEALCAIQAAIYLACLGPTGLVQLGETCMANARYVMRRINEIDGFRAPLFEAPHFKEFTVNSKKPIEDVHRRLLDMGIHGGKIIKNEFPELGETSLYCVTEIHSIEDMDKLIWALTEISRNSGASG
ncbi:MAG: aminomethyl-transferring glycine dehydrogenase subunit GcvPA [Candidatus Jordarchaeaceae archaeon]